MKISVILCLAVLVIITVPQLGSTYEKRVNQGVVGQELFFDNSSDDECCQQNGSDIIMKKPGPLEVVLDGELVFEVCSMNCDGDFLVCYESDPSNQNVLQLCDTKCGFYVITQNDSISVMKRFALNNLGKPKVDECESFKMVNEGSTFRNRPFPTCAPKIAENGMVKLNVMNASSDCPVIIKNATIIPKTTTAPPTTTPTAATGISNGRNSKSNGSGNGTETTAAPESFFQNYWWIFFIIGLFVLALVAVGVVIYCLKCKKPKKPTPAQQPAALRTIQDSKSPVVLQPSVEPVKSRNIPTSILEPSSIISRKSVLEMVKKEEEVKQDDTDLASMKPIA